MLKKFLCGLICAAMLPLSVPVFAVGEAREGQAAVKGGSYTFGENLFENPNFEPDGDGGPVPQWYVGKDNDNRWDLSEAPDPQKIGTEKGPQNLIPLQPAASAEAANGGFYYSTGDASSTGSNSFLCESVSDDYKTCTWNGQRSLQAYVPIEGGKTYRFSYWAHTENGAEGSVRYGAINSQNFYDEGGHLIWSDDVAPDNRQCRVDNTDGNNFGTNNAWIKYELMFTADSDADYFFFNLYWLQVSTNACINGFTLQEEMLSPIPEEVFDSEPELVKANDGSSYIALGGNLFQSPNFIDEDGNRQAPQWFVGDNETNAWNNRVPNPDPASDGYKNLTPLVKVVIKDKAEGESTPECFYYSYDRTGDINDNNYLCEHIDNHEYSFWNGKGALQAYVKIEPNKTYYFSYYVYTKGGNALSGNPTVRYGPINSGDYCDYAGTPDGKVKWSGSGELDANRYNGSNLPEGKPWTKYDAVITSDENADYFFYNLYWLQTTDYVCINGFTLVEIYPVPVEELGAELGYDEAQGFTVDFPMGVLSEGEAIHVYREPDGEGEAKKLVSLTANKLGENDTLSVAGNSNAVYTVIAAKKDSAGKTAYRLGRGGLYDLVVKEVVKEDYQGKTLKGLSPERVSAANRIITRGGFISDSQLVSGAGNIMEFDSAAKKATIKDDYSKLGIGFTVADGKLYVGSSEKEISGEKNASYKYLTIGDISVTLSGRIKEDGTVDTEEAVTLSLDSVNIEFVETFIEETEANAVGEAQDFVPEL